MRFIEFLYTFRNGLKLDTIFLLQTKLLKLLDLLFETSNLTLSIAETLLLSSTNLSLNLLLPAGAVDDAL